MAYGNTGYIHEQLGLRQSGNTYERVLRPRPFRKPPGLRPVKGGRWSIRKKRDGTWRAWTNGRAAKWSRRFNTHEEAVIWAHLVAKIFKNNSFDTANLLVDQLWKELKAYQQAQFYTKPGDVNQPKAPF